MILDATAQSNFRAHNEYNNTKIAFYSSSVFT